MPKWSAEALAKTRALRGARRLDEHGPDDWRTRIDRESFNIGSPQSCTLGQAFRHLGPERAYSLGLAFIGIRPGHEAQFGFDSDPANGVYDDHLNDAWLALLAEGEADGR
jgi:hypothetical protein